ncbi:uncharacterized protein SCHCODRAFT_02686115 [Schizophyllum commune H4-8]|nr:uncharacterized protein SCHCODRAFT_02686115 [Schizophyllum commune H4-8]KAI5894491.1 hypothetical protein SCHCODRAFT_02686115 [Schizophyllum commune H4-8]
MAHSPDTPPDQRRGEDIDADHGPKPHQRAQLVEPDTVLERHVGRPLPRPAKAELQHHTHCRRSAPLDWIRGSPLHATTSILADSAASAQRLRGHSTHARQTTTAASTRYYADDLSRLSQSLNSRILTLPRVAMRAKGSTPSTIPVACWQEAGVRAELVRSIARKEIANVEQVPMTTSARTEGGDQVWRRLAVLGHYHDQNVAPRVVKASRGQASSILIWLP